MPKFTTACSLYDPEEGEESIRESFEPGDDVPQWAVDKHPQFAHLYSDDADEHGVVPEFTDNYEEQTTKQLQALLEERGLSHAGNKVDLVERLRADDQAIS